MRSSPKDTSVTGGSVKNAKYHIAIVRTVKQILSCESKHSQRLLIIATEPLKSGDHCRPVPPLLPELLPNPDPNDDQHGPSLSHVFTLTPLASITRNRRFLEAHPSHATFISHVPSKFGNRLHELTN